MIKVMFVSFWFNLFLSFAKLVVGVSMTSSALIADSISSFSDMITDMFSIIGGLLSKRRSNKTHPFGYTKIEYIAGLLISLIIISLGVYLIYNVSFTSFEKPHFITIIFIIWVILSKYMLVKYLSKKGLQLNSDIIIASSKESKADLLGSIVVLISTILMYFSYYFEFLIYSNVIGTIIISLLILKTGFNILIDNVNELTYQTFSGKLNEDIKKIILNKKEVEKIKKIYIFKYGRYYQLLAEIILKKDIMLSKANDIREEIEVELKKKNVKYIYIEMMDE